ncbi:MFS transporter [Aestuariicella hydrocarbonica]|uniref:MFS transporter n=1 Tax=Pseudomaricurvus hydrocarbonicus TaxID=1470433 RepID=A0A9E5MME2_9GAMM|nr:MFS transporter [Aestuariicella hydrocarbonica]NHO66155.1 MFS transporter [Aestuariicella hydrocarbonica]
MALSGSALGEWRKFWFLPLAAALGYATSVLHVYSFGPFIEPLQQEFGWSRAQISSGLTIASIVSAVFCIPIGILVDRVGPRRIGLIGILLMCGSVALLGTATGTKTNWLMLWVGTAIGTLWIQATVWTSAVTSRFEASRGLALAITLSGAAISATLFPLIATWLIGEYGWRFAFRGLSGMWVLFVFPILFMCFRSAHDEAIKPTKAANPEPKKVLHGLTLAEGLRSPALYKLLMASGLFSFTAIGIVVHFVPILTDRGAEPLAAAGIASLVGVFSIIGRLGTGFLLDRFRAHLIGATAFLIPLVGCSLLLLDGSNPMYQALAAAIFGLTLGSEVDVIAYLAAKYFGLKNFGALYGSLVMALSLGTAFGPLVAGAVFDQYDSYTPFLQLTMILMGASALALFSLGSTPSADGSAVTAH